MKFLKKASVNDIFRNFCIVAIIVTLFLTVIYIFVTDSNNEKKPSEFATVEECLQDRINMYVVVYPEEKDRYSYLTKIYSYENDKQYVEIFNSPDTTVWFYILDKISSDGKISYRYNYSESIMLNDEWQSVKNYKFKISDSEMKLDNREDTIIQTKINFIQYNKKYGKYLLFTINE